MAIMIRCQSQFLRTVVLVGLVLTSSGACSRGESTSADGESSVPAPETATIDDRPFSAEEALALVDTDSLWPQMTRYHTFNIAPQRCAQWRAVSSPRPVYRALEERGWIEYRDTTVNGITGCLELPTESLRALAAPPGSPGLMPYVQSAGDDGETPMWILNFEGPAVRPLTVQRIDGADGDSLRTALVQVEPLRFDPRENRPDGVDRQTLYRVVFARRADSWQAVERAVPEQQ